MTDAFICDAIRTPIGRYGGALSKVRPDDLAALPIKALMERNPDLDPSAIEDITLGCANQAGEDNRNVARMAALLAGLPTEVPGGTVNRLCGSGLDAVSQAARAIRCGDADLLCALTEQPPGTCPVGFGCTVFDCAVPGMPDDVCGADGECIPTEEGFSLCVAKCSAAETCLPGAACADLDGDPLTLDAVCWPFCAADTECRPGEICDSGECTPMP